MSTAPPEPARPARPTAYDRPSHGASFAAELARAAEKRATSRRLGILTRLWPYVARRPWVVSGALVFLLLAAAASLTLPRVAGDLVDDGFLSGDITRIDQRFLALGGVALSVAIFSALRYYFVTRLGETVVADLRADVYDHLISLSPGFFRRVGSGEALSRLTSDAQIVETLIASAASVALRNGLMIIGGLALLFATSVKLAAGLFLLIPVLMVPLFLLGGRVRKLSVVAQDRLADASANASEAIDAVETIQAFGAEDRVRKTFRDAIEAARLASQKRIGTRAQMTAAVIALVFAGIAVILWLGARAVLAGDMTPGALTKFVFYAIMTAGAFAAVTEAWGDVMRAAGATERLVEILNESPEIAAPATPATWSGPVLGAIRLENVSFSYADHGVQSALRHFSLEVKPGETVALVGPSGAGKSTVFRLLLRFFDPADGTVSLDGLDARAVDPRNWRRNFAYVAQDMALFTGSAADNIQFGAPDASSDDIRAAAESAEVLAFAEQREGGLNAPLGLRAKALSGGERQRLALARALVRDAPVLLLDEATSALDAENERLVQKAILAAARGRTTLIIAHRLATILRADRIVVMDDGRIVETGTHAELINANGLYAHLARLQFQTDTAQSQLSDLT